MITEKGKYGMGWLPDYPDLRDYTERTEGVRKVLGPTGLSKAKGLPASVDLRQWCSPVEDQKKLGSCTANAALRRGRTKASNLLLGGLLKKAG